MDVSDERPFTAAPSFSMNTNRQPKGSPIGGQFAPGSRDESSDIGLDVDADDAYAGYSDEVLEALGNPDRIEHDDQPVMIDVESSALVDAIRENGHAAQIDGRPAHAWANPTSQPMVNSLEDAAAGDPESGALGYIYGRSDYLVVYDDEGDNVHIVEPHKVDAPHEFQWGRMPNSEAETKAAARALMEAQDKNVSRSMEAYEAGIEHMSPRTAAMVNTFTQRSIDGADNPTSQQSSRALSVSLALGHDSMRHEFADQLPAAVERARNHYDSWEPDYARVTDADYDKVLADGPNYRVASDLAWADGSESRDAQTSKSVRKQARWNAQARVYGTADVSKATSVPDRESPFVEEEIPGVSRAPSGACIVSPERNAQIPPRWRNADGVYIGHHATSAVRRSFPNEYRDFEGPFALDHSTLPRKTSDYRAAEALEREQYAAYADSQGADATW